MGDPVLGNRWGRCGCVVGEGWGQCGMVIVLGGCPNIKPHCCPPSISLYILLLLFMVLGDVSSFTAGRGGGGVLDCVGGHGAVNLRGIRALGLC